LDSTTKVCHIPSVSTYFPTHPPRATTTASCAAALPWSPLLDPHRHNGPWLRPDPWPHPGACWAPHAGKQTAAHASGPVAPACHSGQHATATIDCREKRRRRRNVEKQLTKCWYNFLFEKCCNIFLINNHEVDDWKIITSKFWWIGRLNSYPPSGGHAGALVVPRKSYATSECS
jgi:hypothetical protein